ncbi:MAG: putative sensor domain DACNV-containing protein [Limisphaerales bacterium]
MYARWDEYARYWPATKFKPATRPPQSVLVKILNTCFFASLKQEEGRPTQFNLVLCGSVKLSNPAFRYSRYTKLFNLMRFASPRTFSTSELVRLAPACEPDKTLLLVSHVEKKAGLFLWGIVDVGKDSSGSHVSLSELQVRVLAPGELTIILHGHTLCNYKNGKVLFPERSLVNSGCIYRFFKPTSLTLVREVMVATGQKSNRQIHERDFRAISYLFTLQKIAERIHEMKHGGCIFIVPEKKKPLHTDVKYQCGDKTIWICLKGKWILHHQYYGIDSATSVKHDAETATSLQSQMQDVENGLRDALDAVARLTAVDGAVVINRKLELIGFGTVVKLGQTAPYKVFRCEDRRATQKKQIAIESYGTRHRSAFEFCFRNQPSVAIVVSQDGGVKTVTRVGKHIYFWENIFFDASTETAPTNHRVRPD